MLPKSSLAVGLFASLPLAHSVSSKGFCSSFDATAEWKDSIQDVIANERSGNFTAFAQDIVVDTYIHVVTSSKKPEDGYLSKETIDKQMEVLNDDFKKTGFSFVLKDTDYTINANWARDGDEMGMKKALRKGPYSSLNLYFLSQMKNGYAGYCYYPTTSGSPGSRNHITDGCTMTWKITPGGPLTENNMGRVTSHEVGHWAGLLHTFDGGCSPGDYVDDTNPQASATRGGCPKNQRSCGGNLDPVDNQMDYSNDKCRTTITPGQVKRMQGLYDKFRKGN